ncbi:D-2-hydroxyacid dehydrogenase family protein [Chelativorans salis]|uniref:D-2-hydroxyacid dehydrogenase family protein n=1 Tax=Chelativorans salis TaxID=2978478 RepID=A0ABT2LQ59_9HYPH|nr:D-2-hydroxyacid dehydrogenase family protein [Chelativorans sp. EGI FJ00035]MCT7376686.1 D-2-hydroxyacid dehydrogenase family protein [Chelativorans sp. EGI FJ00035]
MKVHILDDYHDTLRHLPSFGMLADHDVTVWTDRAPNEEALAGCIENAEALVLFRDRTAITESLVEKLPDLRLVSMRGTYPHVDVPALTKRGIAFCTNLHSDSFSFGAAELTFALMLAAMRNLPEQIASVRAGHWQAGVGRSLRGRTLGLYGYGRIARAVAGFARSFGMEIVWWASEDGRARASADGETVANSREAFFAEPDVVSVHLRLTPETREIVTRSDLARMRPDALFVNTARAGLVEDGALIAALDAGRPGRAAVDVFRGEPVTDPKDPQIAHAKIIPTPHIGFVTQDELDMQFSDIYQQVNAFCEGAPINLINPEVLG